MVARPGLEPATFGLSGRQRPFPVRPVGNSWETSTQLRLHAMMERMITGRDVVLDMASAIVRPIPTPLVLDESTIWKPHHLFARRTAGMYRWSAHVSALAPGAIPHPPHTHEDEEILMLLAGEVDIIVPEASVTGGDGRLHLRPGQFAYYPSSFPHTLQTTSPDAANYLMFRWSNPKARKDSDELRFGVFDPWGVASVGRAQSAGPAPTAGGKTDTSDESGGSLAYRRVFEGPTSFLPRFHCHVSTLAAGGGYPAHADPYDLAIVLLEG